MNRRRRVAAALVALPLFVGAIVAPVVDALAARDDFGRVAATPTAQYTARFDATWTADTHPINYPIGAHWSSLVGGTHDASTVFWQAGQLASLGIKDMAERGLTAPLVAEVQAQINAGHAHASTVGGSIATGAGVATATLSLTQQFSHATLVTMIAPSPDWFVGISGLPLFVDGEWLQQVRVPLYAYDSGTDSGPNYNSPNQVTMPPQPIALNPAAPFANGVPLGFFTITRTDAPINITVPATSAGGVAAVIGLLAVVAVLGLRRRRAKVSV